MNKLLIGGITLIAIVAFHAGLTKYISQQSAIERLTKQIELIKTVNEINKTTVNEYLKKSEALEKELSEIKSKISNWSNSELPSEFNNLFNKNKKDSVPNCKIPIKEN